MMNLYNKTLLSFLLLAVLLAGCGMKNKKNDPNYIKVGIEAGLGYKVAQVAQKIAKEKYGLTVELVQFNDFVMPNVALNEGDLDVNAYQHKPYLDMQSKQRGYKFAILGNTFVYPIAGYSKKIKKLEELKDESTIVIPNDPTNEGRSLLLLQKQGLIKLKEGVGILPTITDIVSNPKKLKIVELEAPQLTRALDDANVTIAIINSNFSAQIGLIANRDGVFVEDKDSPYVNLIVSREDNKNEEKVKKFVLAFQSPEVAKAAEDEFKGGAIKGW
jgi:D-methionine transport system substrate-binding protein